VSVSDTDSIVEEQRPSWNDIDQKAKSRTRKGIELSDEEEDDD
jgi:hypothetical protein